jgi:lipopolysaccharide/colanic/teichoic acid biosynthesis glycosyltransferase
MIRVFDVAVSITALIIALPFLIGAAIAIKLSSPGPVLYFAERVGLGEKRFLMYKLRSMHVNSGGSEITATRDSRVFLAGRVIRALKLDELPQFLNVLKGEMSVVGPRPEAPGIVAAHYSPWMMETLRILPGVTSPGAIFFYAYSDTLLEGDNPEQAYVDRLLAPKLALDLAYAKRMTVWSNMIVVAHTAVTIIGKVVGKPIGPQMRDIEASRQWVSDTSVMRGQGLD